MRNATKFVIIHSKYFAVSDWLQFLGSVILHNQLVLTIFGRHHTFYGFNGVGTHVTSNHSFEQEVRDSEFYGCLKTCEDGCPKIGARASWFHQHNKLKT